MRRFLRVIENVVGRFGPTWSKRSQVAMFSTTARVRGLQLWGGDPDRSSERRKEPLMAGLWSTHSHLLVSSCLSKIFAWFEEY